jgi:hypothetical protein
VKILPAIQPSELSLPGVTNHSSVKKSSGSREQKYLHQPMHTGQLSQIMSVPFVILSSRRDQKF